MDGMVFLEDVLKQMSTFAKVRMLITRGCSRRGGSIVSTRAARARRAGDRDLLERQHRRSQGVMLTHRNILSNVDPPVSSFSSPRTRNARRAAVLPTRSASPARCGCRSSRAGRRVPSEPDGCENHRRTGEQYRATLIISTPTFCARTSGNARPSNSPTCATPSSVRKSCARPIAVAFKEKFGVDLLEGYGCTEMAPIVCVNTPDVNDRGEHQRGAIRGSVGQPIPGVVAKVVDL